MLFNVASPYFTMSCAYLHMNFSYYITENQPLRESHHVWEKRTLWNIRFCLPSGIMNRLLFIILHLLTLPCHGLMNLMSHRVEMIPSRAAVMPDTSIISWVPLHNHNNASNHYWFGAKGFSDWETTTAATAWHSAVRLVGWPQHPSIVSGWSINNVFPSAQSIAGNSHYSKSQIHS